MSGRTINVTASAGGVRADTLYVLAGYVLADYVLDEIGARVIQLAASIGVHQYTASAIINKYEAA